MLELLAKVTRSIQPIDAKEFLNETRLRFWFQHVLPLLFEVEPAIQQRAIAAFEDVYPLMIVAQYESHIDWPVTKEIIAGQ